MRNNFVKFVVWNYFANSLGIPAIRIENNELAGGDFPFVDYFRFNNLKYVKFKSNCIDFDYISKNIKSFTPNINKIQEMQKNLLRVSPLKDRAVICCFAKKESKYIREWVDYHLKLGFDRIYIFNNDVLGDYSLYKVLKNYKNVVIFDERGNADKMLQKIIYGFL